MIMEEQILSKALTKIKKGYIYFINPIIGYKGRQKWQKTLYSLFIHTII
ncbi:hypothetical protein TREAZ_2689 [Leadbettera azotonutricia ZAS-9]|uniref:Uncharacterized protein n=1 Tax=Leadbettera azotonutricia (strain ATCC BAA-888 / DSM 13862 / ZAS-9) TaxID=545695 RepID=F5YDS5_LEAAZ|nr:hypothetical protein TREAZ_2689 [Leadbettera azotonutricia ZAS-9]